MKENFTLKTTTNNKHPLSREPCLLTVVLLLGPSSFTKRDTKSSGTFIHDNYKTESIESITIVPYDYLHVFELRFKQNKKLL